jgi:hypothetical protein
VTRGATAHDKYERILSLSLLAKREGNVFVVAPSYETGGRWGDANLKKRPSDRETANLSQAPSLDTAAGGDLPVRTIGTRNPHQASAEKREVVSEKWSTDDADFLLASLGGYQKSPHEIVGAFGQNVVEIAYEFHEFDESGFLNSCRFV